MKFFCIFCPKVFESRQEIFEHLIQSHLSESSVHCSRCDFLPNSCSCPASRGPSAEWDPQPSSASPSASPVKSSSETSPEKEVVITWVERFLLYQDNLRRYRSPVNPINEAILNGCPVCDKISWVFRTYEGTTSASSSLISKSGGNLTLALNHVYKHLQYFPYECLKCREKLGRSKQYLDLTSLEKHIQRYHSDSSGESPETRTFTRMMRIPKLQEHVSQKLNLLFAGVLTIRLVPGAVANDIKDADVDTNCAPQVVEVQPKESPVQAKNSAVADTSTGHKESRRRYVECRNCDKSCANRHELKIHHNEHHQGKPILMFKPPKKSDTSSTA